MTDPMKSIQTGWECREDERHRDDRPGDLHEDEEDRRDEGGAPPASADGARAVAECVAGGAILEEDLLLDELPVDELPDRDRDPDHRYRQNGEHEDHEQLREDDPPEARAKVCERSRKPVALRAPGRGRRRSPRRRPTRTRSAGRRLWTGSANWKVARRHVNWTLAPPASHTTRSEVRR